MPDPNTEHGLRVQLATALREAEELRDAANTWLAERDALRAERDRLETAARAYIEGHELALTRAETAEAALAAARRECEGLKALLREAQIALSTVGCIPEGEQHAQEVLRKLEAALAAPAGGEGGKRGT